jgi:hypothetical protein
MITKGAIKSFTALLIACAGLGITAGTAVGASLTITPSTVATDYTGLITLDITGLASGQTVMVETFLDTNGNGMVDTGEMLVQSFQLTDGQALSIGGVRNPNVPGDEDGAADQKIRALLNFAALAEANRGVAQFVYKVSPVTSGFTPTTAVFGITQPAYAQKVMGKVTSGGSAVPYAFTFLIDPALNGPIVLALADGNGNFTLNAAPGSYAVAALKAGFVSDLSALPVVTVNANATITQNLSLTAADRSISGRLSDLDSDAGIPGVQITAQSEGGLFALVFSDASGNFQVPVSSASSQWGVYPSEKTLALLGYLTLTDDYGVDVSSGDVSGVSIQLPKATALIYGTLTDGQQNPLAGVSLYADNGQYEGYGFTVSGGNYVVGVTAGTWWVGPDSEGLAALGYLAQGSQVAIEAGEARQQNFEARSVTAYLSGRATDDGGNPVDNACINAWADQGANAEGQTDDNGNFSLGVAGGTWHLQLCNHNDLQRRGLVPPALTYSVQDGVDVTSVPYVARRATAQITGWLQDSNHVPIAGVGVSARITVSGTPYDSWTQTDSAGTFSLGAFNGTWQVDVSCGDLQPRGYRCVSSQSVNISGTNGTANFTVQLPCVGDCGDDRQVTIDDILTMVNIALGNLNVSACPAGNTNRDGQITVDEILTAVNNALNGCG